MPYLNDLVPVVIDPGHERFAESGLLYADSDPHKDQEDITIEFSDGVTSKVNNGITTGLAQYYVFPRSQSGEAGHLINLLPDIKDRLNSIFQRASNLQHPEYQMPEIQSAQAAASFLIIAALYPDMFN